MSSLWTKLRGTIERSWHRHPRVWMAGSMLAGGAAIVGTVAAISKKPAAPSPLTPGLDTAFFPYIRTVKGQADLKSASDIMSNIAQEITYGKGVFASEETIRTIVSHKGTDAIDLVVRIFYDEAGNFSFDQLGNHAACQTSAAEVVQFGIDYASAFFNQVYRTPTYNPTKEQWLAVFPNDPNGWSPNIVWGGLPIDPQKDATAFQSAVFAAMDADQYKYIRDGDLAAALGTITKILASGNIKADLSKLATAMPTGYYVYAVPTSEREWLARFARDMSAKQGKPIDTLNDADGNPIQEPVLTVMQASLGLAMVAKMITTLESDDPNVNPCIRVLDAGLVFEMFATTLGTVLTLAFGPALSAVSVAIRIATTVQQLANLAK